MQSNNVLEKPKSSNFMETTNTEHEYPTFTSQPIPQSTTLIGATTPTPATAPVPDSTTLVSPTLPVPSTPMSEIPHHEIESHPMPEPLYPPTIPLSPTTPLPPPVPTATTVPPTPTSRKLGDEIQPDPIDDPCPPVSRSKRQLNEDSDNEDFYSESLSKVKEGINKLTEKYQTMFQQRQFEPVAKYESFKPEEDLRGNETVPPINREPIYIPPDLSREALMTDVAMKTFVANIDEIGTLLGKEIKKSTELATAWQSHIKNIDEYIKSLSGMPWKKLLTYSACILTIGAFIYKMAAWRMIPNFLSNLISIVPNNITTVTPSGNVIRDVPKPNIENTVNAIMHTPLTPITIVTCIGGMTIAMAFVKGLVWFLRKAPK